MHHWTSRQRESPIWISLLSPVCFFLVFSVCLLVRINNFVKFGNEIAEMWQCRPINIKRSENKEYSNDQTASRFTRKKKEKIKIYTWKNNLISSLTLGIKSHTKYIYIYRYICLAKYMISKMSIFKCVKCFSSTLRLRVCSWCLNYCPNCQWKHHHPSQFTRWFPCWTLTSCTSSCVVFLCNEDITQGAFMFS